MTSKKRKIKMANFMRYVCRDHSSARTDGNSIAACPNQWANPRGGTCSNHPRKQIRGYVDGLLRPAWSCGFTSVRRNERWGWGISRSNRRIHIRLHPSSILYWLHFRKNIFHFKMGNGRQHRRNDYYTCDGNGSVKNGDGYDMGRCIEIWGLSFYCCWSH